MKVATIVGVYVRKSQFIITISDGLYLACILEDGLTLIERWAFRRLVKESVLDTGYTFGVTLPFKDDESYASWCVRILLSSHNATRALSPCKTVSAQTMTRYQKVSYVFKNAGLCLRLPELLTFDIVSSIGNSIKSQWPSRPDFPNSSVMTNFVGGGN